MHRDLKGANLLVNNRGELKITDFGLARPIEENRLKYTPGVVTRWYRPPELLFGSDIYDESIDIWGAGCIIAEMYIRKPLFGASSDLDQLKLLCMYCGTPTEENYPGVSELPDFSKVQLKPEKRILREYLESKKLDKNAIDLIDKMLIMDPKQRITAQQALEHEYFKNEPLPCLPSEIGQFESSHVYTVQQQKEKEQQQQQIQNESKRSRFENERRHEEKDSRRGHYYNDHDSRHSEANYHGHDQLRYGEHLPPPPPPPPPSSTSSGAISTVRDRHASSRDEIRREGGHHYHHDTHNHRQYDDRRHHDRHGRYSSDNHERHYYDDQYHREERYRKDERKVEYHESRISSHRASHDDIGNIGSAGERVVLKSSTSGLESRSRSRSPERRKISDVPSSGTERNRRAISYEDL